MNKHPIPVSIMERELTGDPYRDWSLTHPTYDWHAEPRICWSQYCHKELFTRLDFTHGDQDLYREDVADMAAYVVEIKVIEMQGLETAARERLGREWEVADRWRPAVEKALGPVLVKWRIAYNVPLEGEAYVGKGFARAVCLKAARDFNEHFRPRQKSSPRKRAIPQRRGSDMGKPSDDTGLLRFVYRKPGFAVSAKNLDVLALSSPRKPPRHGSPLSKITLMDLDKVLRGSFVVFGAAKLRVEVEVGERDESEADAEFLMNGHAGRLAELVHVARARGVQGRVPTFHVSAVAVNGDGIYSDPFLPWAGDDWEI